MKKKSIFVLIIIYAVLLVIYLNIKPKINSGIYGKVQDTIEEFGSETPVKILKAVGVYKINSIKRDNIVEENDVEARWTVNVNDDVDLEVINFRNVELGNENYNWSIQHTINEIKKVNEINKGIDCDDFAFIYNFGAEYTTNIDEWKIFKFEDVDNIVNQTTLQEMEKSNSISPYSALIITDIILIILVLMPIYVIVIQICFAIHNRSVRKEKEMKEN